MPRMLTARGEILLKDAQERACNESMSHNMFLNWSSTSPGTGAAKEALAVLC